MEEKGAWMKELNERLMTAIYEGSSKAVKFLLMSGADPNCILWTGFVTDKFVVTSEKDGKATNLNLTKTSALILACETPSMYNANQDANLKIIRLLLDAGADVNAAIMYTAWEALRKDTPLFAAIDMEDVPAIKLLLTYNADPSLKDADERDALSCAVYSCSSNDERRCEIIRVIVKAELAWNAGKEKEN